MFTKGETRGGLIQIFAAGKRPIAFVHPKYVDRFLAVIEMYKALLDMTFAYRRGFKAEQTRAYNKAMKALALADGRTP